MNRALPSGGLVVLPMIAALGAGCSSVMLADGGSGGDAAHDAGASDGDGGSRVDVPSGSDVVDAGGDVVSPPVDVIIEDTGPGEASTGATDSGAMPTADNAEIVSDTFPAMLACNATGSATVTVRNSGTSTWTSGVMIALGAVGDADPFTATTRIDLGSADSVPPGGMFTFTVDLTAPPMGGTYTSDWQMVHDPGQWFGAVLRHDVVVACPPGELDLHQAILFDNPQNEADWPITTTITALSFGTDGVHVEFSKRDGTGSWPDITPPGWDGPLEYTLGMAEYINGQWYASAAIQFWRGLYASGGNVATEAPAGDPCTHFGQGSSCQVAKNWYYDGRWGNLSGYQPSTGETIGIFVVAGNVRGVTDGSQSPVQERSNVVLVPFPDSTGANYTF